ncbi:ATP-binding protein [Succinispira mobilis]|uniref:ATP-binding protein n=1 Tax=Succinispira mobilis TaxID=78120 RepID=UPI0003AAC7C5|nr:ATP-binding protein [Succinispira mobilis]
MNALINYWQGVLQNLAVETTWEINLGKQNPIDPLDMTAILGNLLRNATEALTKVTAPEKRYLKLVLLTLGDNLVITLDNSFDGQSQQDNEQNYLSSKLDFKSRGIGLDSIRSSVEKYDGTFNMEIQAKNFASSIVLPLPSKKIRANP